MVMMPAMNSMVMMVVGSPSTGSKMVGFHIKSMRPMAWRQEKHEGQAQLVAAQDVEIA